MLFSFDYTARRVLFDCIPPTRADQSQQIVGDVLKSRLPVICIRDSDYKANVEDGER